VVTCYCPDAIALGGGVMQSSALFLEPARAMVRRLVTQVPVDNVRIEPAVLGADAGLHGAACAWLHRYEGLEL
jgi:predicted NBD/HSP70 family sugar kinase